MVDAGGSSLHAALIGVGDLATSAAFYRDHIGLTILDSVPLAGTTLAQHWQLAPNDSGHVIVLGQPGLEIGRIVLVHTSSGSNTLIRHAAGQRHYGLINVNFYTENIYADTSRFVAQGLTAWTEPVRHGMQPSVGAPTEVMLDGPDGVIINLIELTSTEPETRIGKMRQYVRDEFGYNRQGFTPVVTTQHCVRDAEVAAAFYRAVLGMTVLHDDLLDKAEQNHFMGYPEGGRTRVIFLRGIHLFGKVALAQPLNFSCDDLVSRAIPGNIGYFAQAFIVDDLGRAVTDAVALAVDIYSDRTKVYFPGIGNVESVIVRVPGSGALLQIMQKL